MTLASGWCSPHYQRARTHEGDPLGGRTPVGEPRAFFETAMKRETDECIIWPYKVNSSYGGRYGYGQIFIDGQYRSVHVLACERGNGPMPEPGMDAAHGSCHETLCFNPRHLSWKTRKENAADRWRDGTMNAGERNGQAKVTADVVREIRRRCATGERPATIAADYDLSAHHVGAIARREKWKHLD